MVMPPTIEVASLGMWDSLILMVMALVVFGPRRLPQMGRQFGKLMYEIRKASNDFKFQMEEELRNAEEADRRKKEEERLQELTPTAPAENAGTDVISQVPNTGPGAPGLPGVVESPYPDEAFYPAVNAADCQVSDARHETPEEAAYPQIQLPSTGEPVAAARPGKRTAQVKAPAAKKAAGTAKSKQKPVKAPTRTKKTLKEPGSNNA
jgi:sec-independent protein translocase protein TatB